tara:strand:+ start:213 stop:431 length:219 start_codon:yes stop_codon:yes gene_type:complete
MARMGIKTLAIQRKIPGLKAQAHRVGRFAQKSGNIEMALAPIVTLGGAPEVGAGLEAIGAASRKAGAILKGM